MVDQDEERPPLYLAIVDRRLDARASTQDIHRLVSDRPKCRLKGRPRSTKAQEQERRRHAEPDDKRTAMLLVLRDAKCLFDNDNGDDAREQPRIRSQVSGLLRMCTSCHCMMMAAWQMTLTGLCDVELVLRRTSPGIQGLLHGREDGPGDVLGPTTHMYT